MKKWILPLLLSLSVLSCTSGDKEETVSDLELPEEIETIEPRPSELAVPESAAAETIDADDVVGGQKAPVDEVAEEQEEFSLTDAPHVRVVGVDFKGKEGGGTIVIRTTGQASYTTRTNETNLQFVVELANAELPAQFRRPYNMKEFDGPISGLQAYQKRGTKTARFVIQLKESIDPFVMQDGGLIRISAAGGSKMGGGGDGDPFVITSDRAVDNRILSNRNLDDFLLGQSNFYGRKISFAVKDADIRDVFTFLAEESGLNIILSEDVGGKITVKLRKIPWDQALVTIMKSRGLGYVRQGSILRIAPLQNLQKEAEAARIVMESQSRLKPLRVRVFPVSYAKVKDLEGQARDFLSDRGRVKGDERTNSLIVKDIEDNLERIAKLITLLDTQTPQVLIEAKVVEARQSFSRKIGVNWGFSGERLDLGTNGKGIPIGAQLSGASSPPSFGTTGNLNLELGTLDYIGDLNASLSLYEFENLIKVISAPRIMTLNGQKATIEQKTEIPIPVTQQATGSAAATVTFQFKPVVLGLDVVPQITADGGIVMQVKVKREFLGASLASGTPPVNSREASTTVLVTNGQTIVMGGIFQSDAVDQEEGVPFMRKIPILGSLFKATTQGKEKNELLIFLTPRIMNKEKAFRQARGSDS